MRSRKTFFTKGCHSYALASLLVFLFYADRNPVLRVSAVTGQQHVASFQIRFQSQIVFAIAAVCFIVQLNFVTTRNILFRIIFRQCLNIVRFWKSDFYICQKSHSLSTWTGSEPSTVLTRPWTTGRAAGSSSSGASSPPWPPSSPSTTPSTFTAPTKILGKLGAA